MKGIILSALLFSIHALSAQQGWWRAQLHRPDGESVVFNFEWKKEAGKNVWYIRNAAERMKVDNISAAGDSLFIQMPVFESEFRIYAGEKYLSGSWIKGGAVKTLVLPFTAVPGKKRFKGIAPAVENISGRWSVKYDKDSVAGTVAEFKQSGNIVTGTFLNPTGDYRYLEGIVSSDSLYLSSFDGSNAFLFKAAISGNTIGGVQLTGATGRKRWSAVKDSAAAISQASAAMHLRPGEDSLHFSFRDIDGKQVSIADDRFKNKVVVVQLMGSWCPNCMDETAFLSDYYNKNRLRGIEVIALAYEYSTDRERSVKSLQKFRHRFDVQYPVLITGVTVLDSLRTEKTLPELTPIKIFPSSIVLD
nr:TlpA family protein disulfide reductase [Chitinophagaceae bacterium]